MPRIETKHEKFLRIAESRTNKILDMIATLGNCSNRLQYEYTQDEVEQVFAALHDALETEHAKFTFKRSDGKERFRIDTAGAEQNILNQPVTYDDQPE